MKIGVLSDTHIPNKARAIPGPVLERLRHVDHIIHAGDISELGVIAELEKLAPVTAVAGNTDSPEAKLLLGEQKLMTFGQTSIGICHGHGTGRSTPERALNRFKGLDVDCIVFGHSHIPCCRYEGGILLFNPGSPTDKRRNFQYSFGILDVGASITPHLVFFSRT